MGGPGPTGQAVKAWQMGESVDESPTGPSPHQNRSRRRSPVLSRAAEGRRCRELICLPTYNLDPPADGAGPCLPRIFIRGNWASKTPRRWGWNGPRGASIRVLAGHWSGSCSRSPYNPPPAMVPGRIEPRARKPPKAYPWPKRPREQKLGEYVERGAFGALEAYVSAIRPRPRCLTISRPR